MELIFQHQHILFHLQHFTKSTVRGLTLDMARTSVAVQGPLPHFMKNEVNNNTNEKRADFRRLVCETRPPAGDPELDMLLVCSKCLSGLEI